MGFNFAKTFEESRKIYESVLQDDNIGIPIRINKNNKNLSKYGEYHGKRTNAY